MTARPEPANDIGEKSFRRGPLGQPGRERAAWQRRWRGLLGGRGGIGHGAGPRVIEDPAVPGRLINDHQTSLYVKLRLSAAPPLAAARAGFSVATAYRSEADPRLPSRKNKPCGRRRPDPLAEVFDSEVVALLQAAPSLRLIAILEALVRRQSEFSRRAARRGGAFAPVG